MKIELTIKVDYLPSWGLYEGIRELIQNGKDAETEFDAKLKVGVRKGTNILVIENDGVELPHEALLLGHSTKTENRELIGKFGEGLKLGILALVRAGHPVKIRSGSEVWIPSIQRSEKFAADVLVFEIASGRQLKKRVSVEVEGIDEDAWIQMKSCFLFLNDLGDDKIKTEEGSLLTGVDFVGKVFVKGIFVQNNPKFQFGYDFADAELDRDRKMIHRYDMEWRTRRIWQDAVTQMPSLIDSFHGLLLLDAADVEGVDHYYSGLFPSDVRAKIVDAFLCKYGADALPVSTLAESQSLSHYGKRGVIVPRALRVFLESMLGNFSQNKEKLGNEVTKNYSSFELSREEMKHLSDAIRMVDEASESISLFDLDVVDYRDDKIKGMHLESGRIQIAKKILQDKVETLRVLVHEASHRNGGDGQKSHVSRIEEIWSAIVSNILNGESKVADVTLDMPEAQHDRILASLAK